jgi:hypothetical protein
MGKQGSGDGKRKDEWHKGRRMSVGGSPGRIGEEGDGVTACAMVVTEGHRATKKFPWSQNHCLVGDTFHVRPSRGDVAGSDGS